jgi:hypothetical protein
MKRFVLGLMLGLAIGLGRLAHASTVSDATNLVCRFDSAGLCDIVQTIHIAQAERFPGNRIDASAWTDGQTIWYVPAALMPHDSRLTDEAELAMVLAKEGAQAQQQRLAPFSALTCMQQEQAGHRVLKDFWAWLWNGQPPNVVYNDIEQAAAFDTAAPLVNTLFTCRTLFG